MEEEYKDYRHILSLSGGKDSAALALYLKDRIPNLEYVFCDTGKELPETYDYLAKIEALLGNNIVRLTPVNGNFDDLLKKKKGFLPSPQNRWCTEELKIKPFEKYVGNDPVILYVGIRADEPNRKGNLTNKKNIIPKYPFVEDGIRYEDVIRILETTYVGGKPLGLPEYYKWRSRSGCYFCFFQQKREWVGLLENHPELFREAMKYEKIDTKSGQIYTWVEGESLLDLSRPERILEIKREYEKRKEFSSKFQSNSTLNDIFSQNKKRNKKNFCLAKL